jgi:hypothetical protein
VKLGTKGLKLEGLNKRESVDFSDVETVEQLKEKIIYCYIALWCEKCGARNYCKFYDRSEACTILQKVVCNYIDVNLKFVNSEDQGVLREFIRSLVILIDVFSSFEFWQGLYADETLNLYFQDMHPRVNLSLAHALLSELNEFIKANHVVRTERLKSVHFFFEGDSETVALPPILYKLKVNRESVGFSNLKGKGRAQKDKLRLALSAHKGHGVTCFLVLDNDSEVRQNVQDLVGEGLLGESHYIIWDKNFEDNFGEELILKTLEEVRPDIKGKISVDELTELSSKGDGVERSIDRLMRSKGIDGFKFQDCKVEVARMLSKLICDEIDQSMQTSPQSYDGSRTPTSKSCPKLVERLTRIAEEVKRVS